MTFWDFLDKCIHRLVGLGQWFFRIAGWAFIGYLLGAWLSGGVITDRIADTDFGNIQTWAWLVIWPVMFVLNVAWWKGLVTAVVVSLLIGLRRDHYGDWTYFGYTWTR